MSESYQGSPEKLNNNIPSLQDLSGSLIFHLFKEHFFDTAIFSKNKANNPQDILQDRKDISQNEKDIFYKAWRNADGKFLLSYMETHASIDDKKRLIALNNTLQSAEVSNYYTKICEGFEINNEYLLVYTITFLQKYKTSLQREDALKIITSKKYQKIHKIYKTTTPTEEPFHNFLKKIELCKEKESIPLLLTEAVPGKGSFFKQTEKLIFEKLGFHLAPHDFVDRNSMQILMPPKQNIAAFENILNQMVKAQKIWKEISPFEFYRPLNSENFCRFFLNKNFTEIPLKKKIYFRLIDLEKYDFYNRRVLLNLSSEIDRIEEKGIYPNDVPAVESIMKKFSLPLFVPKERSIFEKHKDIPALLESIQGDAFNLFYKRLSKSLQIVDIEDLLILGQKFLNLKEQVEKISPMPDPDQVIEDNFFSLLKYVNVKYPEDISYGGDIAWSHFYLNTDPQKKTLFDEKIKNFNIENTENLKDLLDFFNSADELQISFLEQLHTQGATKMSLTLHSFSIPFLKKINQDLLNKFPKINKAELAEALTNPGGYFSDVIKEYETNSKYFQQIYSFYEALSFPNVSFDSVLWDTYHCLKKETYQQTLNGLTDADIQNYHRFVKKYEIDVTLTENIMFLVPTFSLAEANIQELKTTNDGLIFLDTFQNFYENLKRDGSNFEFDGERDILKICKKNLGKVVNTLSSSYDFVFPKEFKTINSFMYKYNHEINTLLKTESLSLLEDPKFQSFFFNFDFSVKGNISSIEQKFEKLYFALVAYKNELSERQISAIKIVANMGIAIIDNKVIHRHSLLDKASDILNEDIINILLTDPQKVEILGKELNEIFYKIEQITLLSLLEACDLIKNYPEKDSFDNMKKDPNVFDRFVSEVIIKEFDATDILTNDISTLLIFANKLDDHDVDKLLEEAKKLKKSGETLHLSDIYTLISLVKNPTEMKLFQNKDVLEKFLEDTLYNNQTVARTKFASERHYNTNVKDNPSPDFFSHLNLYRIVKLQEALKDPENLKQLGIIISQDLKNNDSELAGNIQLDADRLFTQDQMVSGSNHHAKSFGESSFLLPADISYHLHAISPDERNYAGPSKTDLEAIRSSHHLELVITPVGWHDEKNRILNVNFDATSFNEKRDTENLPPWSVADLGTIHIYVPK